MLSADHIARYFRTKQDEGAQELISHLKLQKLCYYAQGFHLAINGTRLFPERIEAWQHGPVVPDLWQRYKEHGPYVIPAPNDVDFEIYSDSVQELLDEVWDVYGQYSAWKLREMTHIEPPWKNAPQGGGIDVESMKTYFKTLVNDA